MARDITYVDGQLRAPESLFHVPPDPIVCRRTEAGRQDGSRPHIGDCQGGCYRYIDSADNLGAIVELLAKR